MPYTRAWDETQPPGTALAASLDTIIQNFRTDIRERVASIFGLNLAQFSADPVAPISLTLSLGATIGGSPGNFIVQGSSADAYINLKGAAASGHINWRIGKSVTVANVLEFQPSTVADGMVFTTTPAYISTSGFVGNLSGNLTGTVLTAAQGNITSLGTLTGLTLGNLAILALNGKMTWGVNAYVVTSAAGGFRINDSTDIRNNLIMTDAGNATFFGSVTAASSTFGPQVGKVVEIDISGTGYLAIKDTNVPTFRGFFGAGNGVFSGGAASDFGIASEGGSLRFATTSGTIRMTISDSTGLVSAAVGFSGNLTGTILTAAQANITSLGTLTTLNMGGVLSLNSSVGLKYIGNDAGMWIGAVNTIYLGDYAGATVGLRVNFITGLTSSTGGFSGNLTGTLLTAAQGNITSLGTLSGLTVTASIVANGGINMSNFVGTVKLIGGTIGVSHRNNADGADNLLIADNGDTTVRGLLLVSSGNVRGMTVSGLGNGAGAQITLAKVSTVGPPVANAAQQAWLKFIGSDGTTYQVPAFT